MRSLISSDLRKDVRNSSPRFLRSQSGIALVLTLILLSVTLIMAVAFLFISRREQGSVTTQTDATTSRYAADSALADAQAQIAANILAGAQPNPYNFGLLVSTNYINPFGFQPGVISPTNVNYDYLSAGGTLNQADFLLNVSNLFYRPRPPVFITDPNNPSAPPDFRFYLDLNRNGRYDTNGMTAIWVTNNSGQLVIDTTNLETGDPEWIGVLERPDLPHGPGNHFVARYAYIAVPIDNALDLNAIHNQALIPQLNLSTAPMSMGSDGFFRNQGVGTWEINLAAFLADLNTNQWGAIIGSPSYYQYNRGNSTFADSGVAFNDAFALLTNRYAGNYNTLNTAFAALDSATNFDKDNIDGYSDGQLMTNVNFTEILQPDLTNRPWVGADNTNRFFDLPSELFDPTKSSQGFVNRLSNAGTNGSTYDRYTFYRLLSQLGTDGQPESGKINLNYSNAFATFNANGMLTDIAIKDGAETNLTPWTPIQFFTIAADTLLRAYTARWADNYVTNDFGIITNLADGGNPNTGFLATFNGRTNAPLYVTNSFGITNIPVLINGKFVYTPAVNRLLQLAANIYDATQTNFYPHIFRPVFTHDVDGNIFIAGFAEQTNVINRADELNVALTPDLATPIEFGDFTNLVPADTIVLTNIYGVPWIIGAKKGFPNFNEFATESAFRLTRKLEGIRDWTVSGQPHINWTNQMYLFEFTNYFGLEFWNSYRSNYLGAGAANPGVVDVAIYSAAQMALTNDQSGYPTYYKGMTNHFVIPTNLWHGWNGGGSPRPGTPSSFITWTTNFNFFSFDAAKYAYSDPGFRPVNGTNDINYPDTGITNLPHFGLISTNQLQAAIIDYSAGTDKGRIIDYIQLGGLNNVRDLNAEIHANDKDGMFDTTFTNGLWMGVYQQIYMSEYATLVGGGQPVGDGVWNAPQIPGVPTSRQKAAQAAFFKAFLESSDGHYNFDGKDYSVSPTNKEVQAPYTPSVLGVQYITWQANDPLVHYLSSDLNPITKMKQTLGWTANQPENIGLVNYDKGDERYLPWGNASSATGVDQNPYNLSYKDSLVRQSDNWNFPTNLLPAVGWLGRVHRGTPWQSIYLKATNLLDLVVTNGKGEVTVNGFNTWLGWTGDGNLFDATNMAPTEDRLLFDLFTTAFNDNATRGQLSVNTPGENLADWSAVFSGVNVLSNNVPDPLIRILGTYTNLFINPVGPNANNSALAQIVTNIDGARRSYTNSDGLVGVFEHKGDILATPMLTEQSPFLNRSPIQLTNGVHGISDEMYEWLPQQAMSLLSGGNQPTRYVIYSWGQCLQPAPGGVYLGSDYFGMVTNYQVTAETATRAVVRITPTNVVIESFNVLPPN